MSPEDTVSGVDCLDRFDGEAVQWSKKANRWQSTFRSVGGRLYLTDRRLIFRPHRLDSDTGGEEWSADLSDLKGASLYGWLRWIDVEYRTGGIERFVVWPPTQSLQAIDSAITSARVGGRLGE